MRQPFTPEGYVKLSDGIDHVGKSAAAQQDTEWRMDLRDRNRRLRMRGFQTPLCQLEFELEEAVTKEVNEQTLIRSSLAEMHCLEAWRMWLGYRDRAGSRITDQVGIVLQSGSELFSADELMRMNPIMNEALAEVVPLSPEEIQTIRDRIADARNIRVALKLRDEVESGCQNLLHQKLVSAWVLTDDGKLLSVSNSYWATAEADRQIDGSNSHAARVPVQSNSSVTEIVGGRLLVKCNALASAMSSPCGASQIEAEVPGQTSGSTRRKVEEYLTKLMKSEKDERSQKQELLIKECKKHVSPKHLSKRAFDIACQGAKAASTTHEDWKKTRVRKKDSSTP